MEVSRAGALWVRTMRKIKVIFTLGEFMLPLTPYPLITIGPCIKEGPPLLLIQKGSLEGSDSWFQVIIR